MKQSTRAFLLAALCVLFAFSSVRSLMNEPIAQWGAGQFGLALMTVVLVIAGIFEAKVALTRKKQEDEEAQSAAAEEVSAAEGAGTAPDAAQGGEGTAAEQDAQEAPDHEDLSHLDDLSDLEGVELLDVKTVIPETLDEEE